MSLDAVIGQISGDSVCTRLWIEFAAAVVPVRGYDPVCGGAILIRAVQQDTRSGIVFAFDERFTNCLVMRDDQASIPADDCLNGS